MFMRSLICLLLLTTAAQATDTADDNNIIILLDTSGSMGESMGNTTKMEAAQSALIKVLADVPNTTKVGLLTFEGWVFDLSPVGGRRDELTQKIRSTSPGGGTPLSEYTKIAADRLLTAREANRGYGLYKMLIVTDGLASDSGLETYVADALRRGIIISTIGVKMSQDHSLSRQTYYMRADDPNSLTSAVKQVFAESKTQGSNTDVDFEEIAPLSDATVKAVLLALVESRNYPIGEQPPQNQPITVTNDQGSTVIIPQPPIAADNSGGWEAWQVILMIAGGAVVCIIVLAAAGAVISG